MAIFGKNNDEKEIAQKQKYYNDAYPYFEKNNMLNILEKYPEQAAYIGNVMDSKAVAIMNASGPGALEKVQIQQNQILIQQAFKEVKIKKLSIF